MHVLCTDVYGPDGARHPTSGEWAAFTASCSLRDMGTTSARCQPENTAPAGWSVSAAGTPSRRGAPRARSGDAHQPHPRPGPARQTGEPAGQIAARKLEVERIRSAPRRASELTDDAAGVLEAAAL